MNKASASWTVFGSPSEAEKALSETSRNAAEGDFETLVLAQQEYVTRLAHRVMAWKEDVSDVVQDVLLAAYRHWPRFRRDAKVTTWLATITVNVCRTHCRRRWFRFRRQRQSVSDTGLATGTRLISAASCERDEAVQAAVKTLPAKYREVIVLRYLEGFDIVEIASILSRSRATIDAQLSRGREMLRDSLRPWMED
jgi:RNA polymerase sigma-70 factor (ECF subfamily)